MNDTSTKNKNAHTRIQSLESGGFIQIFVVIIIIVVILIYFGIDAKGVWENLIKPVLEWGLNIFVKIIGFLFDIAIYLVNKLKELSGL